MGTNEPVPLQIQFLNVQFFQEYTRVSDFFINFPLWKNLTCVCTTVRMLHKIERLENVYIHNILWNTPSLLSTNVPYWQPPPSVCTSFMDAPLPEHFCCNLSISMCKPCKTLSCSFCMKAMALSALFSLRSILELKVAQTIRKVIWYSWQLKYVSTHSRP